jgi:hypothetical protein
MKKLSIVALALALATPIAGNAAEKKTKSEAAPKPSPVFVCSKKARANKLEGVDLKLFMSGCLQSKDPSKYK